MKTLAAYYSYSGCTERVARALAESLGADLAAIEDLERPSKIRAYTAGCLAARQGKAWPVKPVAADLAHYDRVVVGCPVWAGMPPPAFNAFADQAAWTGRSVVVFVTMAQGGHTTAIRAMTDRITARGGTVVSSFSVKTGRRTPDELAAAAREIARQIQAPGPG